MNRSIQYLISLMLLLFLADYTYAKDSRLGSARHALGFTGGSATGPGLTYRMYSFQSFYQGSIFARFNGRDDVSDFIVGASYGRVLSEISIVKALPPTALVFVSSISGVYSKDQYLDSVSGGETGDEKSIHTGVGIALEMGNTFSPGLLFSLGTTYTLSFDRQDNNWEWNLGPQVNVGMLYNW